MPLTDSVATRFVAPLDVLLLALLLAVGSWGTWHLFSAPPGARAVVWVNGKRVAWYPLEGAESRDSVQGALGSVVVEHGHGDIRILSAPCPGKLCVKQGAVHRTGGKLVCVPSRVVVSIEGDASGQDGLDAIH